MRHLLNSLFLLLCFTTSGVQAEQTTTAYWIEPGVGGGNGGLATSILLRYQSGTTVFSLGSEAQNDICIVCSVADRAKTLADLDTWHALIGKQFSSGNASRLILESGLSLYKTEDELGNESDSKAGLPLRATFYGMTRHIGIGLAAGFIITEDDTYYSFETVIPIGKLR
jgi:hypothetical protein